MRRLKSTYLQPFVSHWLGHQVVKRLNIKMHVTAKLEESGPLTPKIPKYYHSITTGLPSNPRNVISPCSRKEYEYPFEESSLFFPSKLIISGDDMV